MNHASELEAAVRATLKAFAADPNADTLCDLSRAMSRLSSYAGSGKSTGRDREIPGHWIDSSAACDHAHEHIQNMNSAFTSGTTPTESDVRTIKYTVLAATALFGDAVRSDTPSSAGAHTPHSTDPEDDFSVFGIARAAAHLLGSGWQAEPGLHNARGLIQHPDSGPYLLTVGDVGDMGPELYVESGDTRHILWGTDGEDLATLARLVADTIRNLALA